MKAPLLILSLALAAAPAFAQSAPQTKDQLLVAVDAWRHGQLVHVEPPDPVTAEFEPRLDDIAARIKAAQGEADLAQPRKDFENWQHDILAKKFVLTRKEGVTRGTLDEYSRAERVMMGVFTAQTSQVIAARLKQTALTDGVRFDGGGRTGEGDADGPGPGPSANPDRAGTIAAPAGLHINDVDPPPAVTSKPLSLASLWNYIDESRGYKVAEAVFERAKGFAGYCFASVKEGFIAAKDKLWAKISSPTQSGQIGIPPGLAADYQRAVNSNPALLAKLGYRRVDVSSIPGDDPAVIPTGTVFDFKQRCAGYSEEAGHIEIVGSRDMLDDIPRSGRPALTGNEVLACSDGCHGRTLNYFRTYGRKGCMSMYVPVKDVVSS